MCDYKTSDPFQQICPVPKISAFKYLNMTQQQLYNKTCGKKCVVNKNNPISQMQNISQNMTIAHFLATRPASGKTTNFIPQAELREGRPGGNVKPPKKL